MASKGIRPAAAALLFSFSAVVLLFVLFQAPAAPGLAIANRLASALDGFLDGRGLMELATRRNMILLCHAILLLILRDAGVLGARASRRSPPGEATAAVAVAPARPHVTRSAVVAQAARSSAPVPARPHPHTTRSSAVWRRRPRNRAAELMHEHDAAAARRLVQCHPVPVLTTGAPAQAEEADAVASKQIVVVESPTPRNEDGDLLDRHDRAAIAEQLEHPKAIAADGERDDSDNHRIIAVGNDEKLVDMAREQQTAEMEMELADDRTFEEFIESQRRQMRQESLQLLRSGYQVTITRR